VACVMELDVSGAGTPGTYKVEVIQSPAGEAAATFELDPSQVLAKLDEMQQILLASSVPSRRVLSRGETSVREVGRRLFDALLSPLAISGVYRASSAVAAERGEPLRIVLRTSAPELAALPWESMFDTAAGTYVARHEPLVRYVPVPASPPPLTVRLPLRILALISAPRGLAPLDVEREREHLSQALRSLIQRGDVVVQWLEHASWPALQETLLSGSWHIVHFIGHGDFDIEQDEGVLALENEQGRVHRVAAGSFVDLLREADPMPRLVVLNACDSSAAGSTDLFSGTAASLVRGGVSAVTAMQFEISDAAAIAFCQGFYTAIGRGRSIDEAVRSGRVAILGLGEGSLEWITPTLYLRGQETHLFALSDSSQKPAPEAKPVPEAKPADERAKADPARHGSTESGPLPTQHYGRVRPPPVPPAPPRRTGGHRAPEPPAPTSSPAVAPTKPRTDAPTKSSADDTRKWRVKVVLLLAGVLALAAVVTVLVAVSSSQKPSGPHEPSASTVLMWQQVKHPVTDGEEIDLDATADPSGTPDLKWNATEHQLEPVAARGLRLLCGFDPGGRRPPVVNDPPAMFEYMADEGFAIPDPYLGMAPVAVPENDPSDKPKCSFQPGGGSGEGEPGWAVSVLVNTDQDNWSVVAAQRLDPDNLKLIFVTYAL
jgi:hypothetical protein